MTEAQMLWVVAQQILDSEEQYGLPPQSSEEQHPLDAEIARRMAELHREYGTEP